MGKTHAELHGNYDQWGRPIPGPNYRTYFSNVTWEEEETVYCGVCGGYDTLLTCPNHTEPCVVTRHGNGFAFKSVADVLQTATAERKRSG